MREVLNKETGLIETYSEVDYIAKRDMLLKHWESSKTNLTIAKENELNLRTMCIDFMHDSKKEGKAEKQDLGNGYSVSFKVPVNISFIKDENDQTDHDAIESMLDDVEAIDEDLAAKLVKWKPELSKSTYNELSDELKAIVDKVLVSKNGVGSLEIKAPKEVK